MNLIDIIFHGMSNALPVAEIPFFFMALTGDLMSASVYFCGLFPLQLRINFQKFRKMHKIS